ncbi:putative RNA recognition motif domain, nucleotide-binding alpha-beta plait domain superfamily [Helianthus annuus]|uniref:RNA recognition motif domain, nucleotide-binding alpha-beta plait domain superfamily n=2 Tax=Helianthus annuus TaxID=4232 RepID=A0A9K3GUL4_HELAN|nr:heterogeneous nuclear ribonucleoprotein 1 [Helianthus annuus]KAF5756327.1 putative RNA recognition motif domain, nucleotide-binding alpha-beta plait domain superfamily [Helianthus annuus]
MEMDPRKLFIGGISWDTNEERLRDYFQTFGDVTESVIMKDRTTGRARGFGFVVFADPVVAERVVKDKHIIDGRTVEAKKAVPRDDQQVVNRGNGSVHGSPGPIRTKKIFVGGLASTVTESDFKSYFDQFGSTTDAVVMYDHNTQRPRGFGFITYESEESVDRVLHKTFHELNGKMVEVKRAVPKESSPGPNRSNVGGYNYGLSRVSSYLSSLGSYGLTVDGRYSPVMGRNGLGPSSFNIAPGADANYGGNGNFSSNLGYARSVNSMYSLTPNRLSGPNGYGGGSGGDGSQSVFNSRDIWGGVDHSYAHNSQNSSNYGFGAIWGTPSSVASGSSFIGGGNGVNATAYGRNSGNGTAAAAAASFGVTDDSGPSFYADPPWRSSSPDLDIPGLFDYGFGSSDGVQKKSVGYVGYSVANRSNTGIAA